MKDLNPTITITLELQTVLHICMEDFIVLVLNSRYYFVQDLLIVVCYTVETVK